MRRLALSSLTVLSLLCAAASCGSDDDDSDAGPGDQGEPCASPGFTETGCLCNAGGVGKRSCGSDHIWEPCTCPEVTQPCQEGQKVECFVCPGETEPRITTCLQGGTFDCSCD